MSKETALIAVFNSHSKADDAIKELDRSGFDMTKLSIVGKGYHSEEHPIGFYTTGDRMKTWGGVGAFWGGLWGVLVGGAFFWIPGIGPIAAAGPIVRLLAATLEGAALVGGVSAIGAALASIGVPKKSILRYETQLRSDSYLVIVHGTAQEIEEARGILDRHEAAEEETVAA